jgi:hypothetical protein
MSTTMIKREEEDSAKNHLGVIIGMPHHSQNTLVNWEKELTVWQDQHVEQPLLLLSLWLLSFSQGDERRNREGKGVGRVVTEMGRKATVSTVFAEKWYGMNLAHVSDPFR